MKKRKNLLTAKSIAYALSLLFLNSFDLLYVLHHPLITDQHGLKAINIDIKLTAQNSEGQP
jgi:hypothetical protein